MKDAFKASPKAADFKMMNMDVYAKFNIAGLRNEKESYDEMLKKIPVFFVVADFDMMDGPVGLQEFIHSLDYIKGNDLMSFPHHHYWYESDDHIPNSTVWRAKIGGYYRRAGNLSFMVVHAAGHQLPVT